MNLLFILLIVGTFYVFFFNSQSPINVNPSSPSVIKSNHGTQVHNKIVVSTWGSNIDTDGNPFLNYLNDLRRSLNLPPYIHDKELDDIAYAYAKRLARFKAISHVDPETNENVYDRLDKNNIFYLSAGEVLALVSSKDTNYSKVAERIVNMWVQSPTHRAIVLDDENIFTHAGFGMECVKGNSTSYCYAVGVVVSRIYSMSNVELAPSQGAYITLYDEKDLPVYINVDLKSSSDVCLYLVPSYESFTNWSAGKEFSYIDVSCGRSPEILSMIRKGYGLFVVNQRDISTVFSLKVYYDVKLPS